MPGAGSGWMRGDGKKMKKLSCKRLPGTRAADVSSMSTAGSSKTGKKYKYPSVIVISLKNSNLTLKHR
jgi:hypothetical protein